LPGGDDNLQGGKATSGHGREFGTSHTSSEIYVGEHHAKAAADFLKDQFRRLAALALDDLCPLLAD
jgi:hypothetical protein